MHVSIAARRCISSSGLQIICVITDRSSGCFNKRTMESSNIKTHYGKCSGNYIYQYKIWNRNKMCSIIDKKWTWTLLFQTITSINCETSVKLNLQTFVSSIYWCEIFICDTATCVVYVHEPSVGKKNPPVFQRGSGVPNIIIGSFKYFERHVW